MDPTMERFGKTIMKHAIFNFLSIKLINSSKSVAFTKESIDIRRALIDKTKSGNMVIN
jgi:hypothetical protein